MIIIIIIKIIVLTTEMEYDNMIMEVGSASCYKEFHQSQMDSFDYDTEGLNRSLKTLKLN